MDFHDFPMILGSLGVELTTLPRCVQAYTLQKSPQVDIRHVHGGVLEVPVPVVLCDVLQVAILPTTSPLRASIGTFVDGLQSNKWQAMNIWGLVLPLHYQ